MSDFGFSGFGAPTPMPETALDGMGIDIGDAISAMAAVDPDVPPAPLSADGGIGCQLIDPNLF